ncbi:formate/nitrite transporter protein [Besnoitia besnoiti]|uniref:Formate/nitrite transporter protein n=1 Tax=Besnoitia besnoiti TaxID=94643 RepID=A0A2A9MA06_BESBE|nr:formate/nitrite transporter protein [Besnoitia besnoiti]PFH33151.1 formate/nitrite transporter protein [Besnoitia besnoiti]
MVLAASPEAYRKVIEYGIKKTKLRIDRLFLQAIMAGIYVGMAGHACTAIAGGYSTDPSNPLAVSKSTQKFLYASLFPVAFIAIIFTGAELFTGNTMTMLLCLLERRVTYLQLLVNWACSLVGNWLGALFAAYFLSYLPGVLQGPDHLNYLKEVAAHKTGHNFGECFLLAVGCNTYVCLAVWFVIASDDAAGKIMSMWFPIVAFCVAGYEHIIANFYTLQCALMHGVAPGVGLVILKNFIPTLLGNIVGGCGLVGAVYWYNFYPTMCVVQETGQNVPLPENPTSTSAAKQVVADLFNRAGREGSVPGGSPLATPANAGVNSTAGAASTTGPVTTFGGAPGGQPALSGDASGAHNPNSLFLPSANTPNAAVTSGAAPAASSSSGGAWTAVTSGGAAANLVEPSLSIPTTDDCLFVPRASFGGEYHSPPRLGIPGSSRPQKSAVGSGGAVMCRLPSPSLLDQPSASLLRDSSLQNEVTAVELVASSKSPSGLGLTAGESEKDATGDDEQSLQEATAGGVREREESRGLLDDANPTITLSIPCHNYHPHVPEGAGAQGANSPPSAELASGDTQSPSAG